LKRGADRGAVDLGQRLLDQYRIGEAIAVRNNAPSTFWPCPDLPRS